MFDRDWKGVAWKDRTPDQKTDFLYQWCENLTQQVERHGFDIHHLNSRLDRFELKTGIRGV